MSGTDRGMRLSYFSALFLALLASGHVLGQKPREVKIAIGNAPIWQLAFAPDGKTLACVTRVTKAYIGLCDAKTGKEQARFELRHAMAGGLLAFSPDGKRVVAMTGSGTTGKNGYGICVAEIWDIKQQKQQIEFEMEEGEGGFGLFTSDGKTLIVTSRLGGAALYDPSTGKRLAELKGKYAKTKFLAISADDKWLATGHEPNIVTLWDLTKKSESRTFELKQGQYKFEELTALTLSPKGDRLVTADSRGEVLVWDIASGKVAARHKFVRQTPYHYLRFRNQGTTVVAAGADYEPGIIVWNPTTGTLAGNEDGYQRKPSFANNKLAALSPDGTVLATFDFKRGIQLWDLPADADLKKPERAKQPKK